MKPERHPLPGYRETILTPRRPKARTTHETGPRPGVVPPIRLTVERMPSGLHNYDEDLEICPKRAEAIEEIERKRKERLAR